MTVYRAEFAVVEHGIARDVYLRTEAGRFREVRPWLAGDIESPVDLRGVAIPGFANAHSHAFHRALRGRTHGDGGSFWTWRERMYSLAAALEPDSYFTLARATFAEMALAGVTAVGEFHYLHHQPTGRPYDDPNAMGAALSAAAAEAGIRLTLLDVCYLAGGLEPTGYLPIGPGQRRFSDGSAEKWADRVHSIPTGPQVRVGAAIHSVRATQPQAMRTVVEASAGRPLHFHLSEQPAENVAALAYFGRTPTQLLAESGALGPLSTAVHATHLTKHDVQLLGATATFCCFCPTTERDLADGIGPALALRQAGAPVNVGSDQHAVIDLIEEARAVEMHERLISNSRGQHSPDHLLQMLTSNGQSSLGWSDAGRIAVGARADLVAVRLDSIRTAGVLPDQVLLSAATADVDTVIVDDRIVVRDGQHVSIDVESELSESITQIWNAVARSAAS